MGLLQDIKKALDPDQPRKEEAQATPAPTSAYEDAKPKGMATIVDMDEEEPFFPQKPNRIE